MIDTPFENSGFDSSEALYALPAPSLEETRQPFWCSLDHYAVIRVQGPDAQKFMQGQFTCDLNEVTPAQSRLGACCTPKGRMLAQFRIARIGDDFGIRLPREMAQPLLDHLAKYRVFFKVSLSLDEDLGLLGLAGLDLFPGLDADSVLQLDDGAVAIRVPGEPAALELWYPRRQQENWLSRLGPHPRRNPRHWELAQILAGLGELYPATREEFVPQMLNLQSLAGVSFKKGCYTGQEIVARMQYLGTLKKRMHRFRCDAALGLRPGEPVHDGKGDKVGTLVRVQNTRDAGTHLLAVVTQESLEGPLSVLGPDQSFVPLQLQELPYRVEAISNPRRPA